MGELRMLKGIDVLIDAIALLRRDGRNVTATLVGDGAGPRRISRPGRAAEPRRPSSASSRAMPARQAQALGRIMVVPSRAESLPYVVLEAAAAGKPLITTRVGGIPEIYGPLAQHLVPPDDAAGARPAPSPQALDHAGTRRRDRRAICASGWRPRFRSKAMVDGVLAAYEAALEKLAKCRAALSHISSIPISLF